MADTRTMSVARPMLEVSGLDVHYGRVPALQGLNLRLDRGVVAEEVELPAALSVVLP